MVSIRINSYQAYLSKGRSGSSRRDDDHVLTADRMSEGWERGRAFLVSECCTYTTQTRIYQLKFQKLYSWSCSRERFANMGVCVQTVRVCVHGNPGKNEISAHYRSRKQCSSSLERHVYTSTHDIWYIILHYGIVCNCNGMDVRTYVAAMSLG